MDIKIEKPAIQAKMMECEPLKILSSIKAKKKTGRDGETTFSEL